RWPRDWSSDVCSSDLLPDRALVKRRGNVHEHTANDEKENPGEHHASDRDQRAADRREAAPFGFGLFRELLETRRADDAVVVFRRSEERRVGKGCGSVW